jgi:CRP-like cAMP-binding protein
MIWAKGAFSMNDSKLAFLRKVSLFADLPEPDLKRVAALAAERGYRKHDVIFHSDDTGTVLFILKSGTVKIAVLDRRGREAILKLLYPGDFFGEMAILDGQHRSATVTALDRVQALVISREDFLDLMQRNPKILLNMLLTTCRRLRQMGEKIKSVVFADAYGKVARNLVSLMQEKGQPGQEGIVLDLPLSRQELADLAGITRQTLSEVLRNYQQAGVLRVANRRIQILDPIRLQREAL